MSEHVAPCVGREGLCFPFGPLPYEERSHPMTGDTVIPVEGNLGAKRWSRPSQKLAWAAIRGGSSQISGVLGQQWGKVYPNAGKPSISVFIFVFVLVFVFRSRGTEI